MTFDQYLKARKETVVDFVKRANKLKLRARQLGTVQFYRMLAGHDIHTSSLFRALEATRKEPMNVHGRPACVELRDVPIVKAAAG